MNNQCKDVSRTIAKSINKGSNLFGFPLSLTWFINNPRQNLEYEEKEYLRPAFGELTSDFKMHIQELENSIENCPLQNYQCEGYALILTKLGPLRTFLNSIFGNHVLSQLPGYLKIQLL